MILKCVSTFSIPAVVSQPSLFIISSSGLTSTVVKADFKEIFCFAFQKQVELAEFLIIWQIKVAQQANISLWLQWESQLAGVLKAWCKLHKGLVANTADETRAICPRMIPWSKRWPAGTCYSEKCEFRCTQSEPSVHFGKNPRLL